MLPLRATAHTELAYVHDYVENQMTISKRDMDQKVLKIPKIPSLLEEKKNILSGSDFPTSLELSRVIFLSA